MTYSDKSKFFISILFKSKSPISIFLGTEKGISKLITFICKESAFPSPVVSIVNTLFLGGKSFLIKTLNADKSNVISYAPIF